jgi:hypothetical protein
MDIPLYDTLEEANQDGYFSISQIGVELACGRQAVHAWHQRRKTSHFPPVKAEYKRDSVRVAPLFSLDEVRRWKRTYTPHLGGRPVALAR